MGIYNCTKYLHKYAEPVLCLVAAFKKGHPDPASIGIARMILYNDTLAEVENLCVNVEAVNGRVLMTYGTRNVQYGTPAYPSCGVDAVQTPDGGYFVTGYEKTFDLRFSPILIKTDGHGNF